MRKAKGAQTHLPVPAQWKFFPICLIYRSLSCEIGHKQPSDWHFNHVFNGKHTQSRLIGQNQTTDTDRPTRKRSRLWSLTAIPPLPSLLVNWKSQASNRTTKQDERAQHVYNRCALRERVLLFHFQKSESFSCSAYTSFVVDQCQLNP